MIRRHRVLVGCGLGMAAAAVACALGSTGALQGIEHFSWDQRARGLATSADPKIKLILLDQPSLDWGERVNGLAWPWPREVYASIVTFCRNAGARSIAFDVLYTEPSSYDVEDDEALGAAIEATPNFVCAVQPLRDGDAIAWPDAAAAGIPRVEGLDRWIRSHRRDGAVLSHAAFAIDEIAERAAVHGHVRGDFGPVPTAAKSPSPRACVPSLIPRPRRPTAPRISARRRPAATPGFRVACYHHREIRENTLSGGSARPTPERMPARL